MDVGLPLPTSGVWVARSNVLGLQALEFLLGAQFVRLLWPVSWEGEFPAGSIVGEGFWRKNGWRVYHFLSYACLTVVWKCLTLPLQCLSIWLSGSINAREFSRLEMLRSDVSTDGGERACVLFNIKSKIA